MKAGAVVPDDRACDRKITAVIVDDHKIFREGLRTLLESQSNVLVVGEAENGRGAVNLARKLAPDVVIMDVAMPDLNGIEATRQIIDDGAGVKVLALSMHADRRFVTGMLGAGASGYLLKDCAFEELTQAMETVIADETYLSPGVASVVVRDLMDKLPVREVSTSPVLTAREREVLQLLAEGKSTKQIADQLHISVKTVESHRKQIMDKLDIRSVAQLTKYALREGLTSLDH